MPAGRPRGGAITPPGISFGSIMAQSILMERLLCFPHPPRPQSRQNAGGARPVQHARTARNARGLRGGEAPCGGGEGEEPTPFRTMPHVGVPQHRCVRQEPAGEAVSCPGFCPKRWLPLCWPLTLHLCDARLVTRTPSSCLALCLQTQVLILVDLSGVPDSGSLSGCPQHGDRTVRTEITRGVKEKIRNNLKLHK